MRDEPAIRLGMLGMLGMLGLRAGGSYMGLPARGLPVVVNGQGSAPSEQGDPIAPGLGRRRDGRAITGQHR